MCESCGEIVQNYVERRYIVESERNKETRRTHIRPLPEMSVYQSIFFALSLDKR